MEKTKNTTLYSKLWEMANGLRGKMDASEYKNYILGLIFFKFLSDKEEKFLTEELKKEDKTIDKIETYDKEVQEGIEDAVIDYIGYYFDPKYLYNNILQFDNRELISNLKKAFSEISDSTIGRKSSNDLKNLFSDIRLDDTRLGITDGERASLIKDLMLKIKAIETELELNEHDVLGDAYEYLIGKFASTAGKKGGEFYTPFNVSKLLAKLVTIDKMEVKTVYDPTCGSGSLLLRVNDEIVLKNGGDDKKGIRRIYGQELNHTTFNLARMNMFLHKIPYERFVIKNGDTLFDDKFKDEPKFELIVANPPFGTRWEAKRGDLLQDERFFQYNVLAPSSRAELAFIQHMLAHLDPIVGVMASVCPHGVLFRGNSEKAIRKHIIEQQNSLDAIIGLPEKLFFGTGIPAIIWVFKKNRNSKEEILFIDSSKEFSKLKNQNEITDDNIKKIVDTYKNSKEIDKYSRLVSRKEIRENDYNLNLSRYIDLNDEVVYRDLDLIKAELKEINFKKKELLEKILEQEKQLQRVEVKKDDK